MQVVHPAAKLVAMAAKAQEDEIGDATNLVVVFAGVLLEGAEGLLRQVFSQLSIISNNMKSTKIRAGQHSFGIFHLFFVLVCRGFTLLISLRDIRLQQKPA